MRQLKVYTAGPFFNPDQVETCEKVEVMLDRYHYDFFSPRLNGGVFNKDAPVEEREKQAKAIFDGNEEAMFNCDFAVINIDDRDTGTAWEFGYFFGKQIPCVSYSKHGYGSNIMLSQSGQAHFSDLTSLRLFLIELDKIRKNEVSYIEDEDINKMSTSEWRSFVRDMIEKAISEVEVKLDTRFKGISNE